MGNLLIVGYLLNMVFINFTVGTGGLILALFLSIGTYLLGIKVLKISGPKRMNQLEKVSLGTVYIFGVFAAASFFDSAAIIFAVGMIETLVYLIFMNIH